MKLRDLRPKRVGADLRGVCQLGSNVNQNEPEVEAYITGLTTPLSSTEIGLLNTLAASLKSGLGVTSLDQFFDYLNIRAGETAEQSLRNFAKRAHDSTAVNSPTFTAGEGFTGNGTSSYIDVDYIPSAGVNFQLNNASHGLYFRVLQVDGGRYNGCYSTAADGGAYNRIIIGSNGGEMSIPLNSADVRIVDTNTNGLYIVNRLSSSSIIVFRNYIKSTPISSTSSKRPNQKIVELARRTNDGTVGFYNASQISFSFCAKGLTDAHEAVIVDAFEAYMDAKGKGVIA